MMVLNTVVLNVLLNLVEENFFFSTEILMEFHGVLVLCDTQ